MFDNNFGKCRPIFKILPPGDLNKFSMYTSQKFPPRLLHYLVKVENPKMLLTLTAPQQSVDMFLRTL